MEAFVWNQRFVTGLEKVDAQHHHLVDIINQVGDLLMATDTSEDTLQGVFKQLAEYARFHFSEEERLMDAVGIDKRHKDRHTAHHAQFIQQLVQMWRARATMVNPAELLHGFLVSWLSFHILDEDQSMARQMVAIRAGDAAEKAYSFEYQAVDNNVSALLDALHKLYHLMSVQNHELANANLGLEKKVAERTSELTAMLKKVEDTQNQILQSEKMAAIGQLAAGVAHEINNPIGFVNSNLGTLKNYVDHLLGLIDIYDQCTTEAAAQFPRLVSTKEELDIDFLRTDIVALLAESRDGLDRVKKIVQDLKDFSHADEAELREADINAGLDSTLNVVWNELKYKVDIVKEYGDLPLVRCVPGQLNQVFMNLFMNAAHAIEQRGTITLRTGVKGAEVWVEVTDSGCGMTAEIKKRIFEPFFTTKPVGKGTGLGLSLSYDIVVKKHGGRFEVESEPGQGSTFRVCLPIDTSAHAIS